MHLLITFTSSEKRKSSGYKVLLCIMTIRRGLRYILYNTIFPLYQKLLVWRLRHKDQINVVFVAMSLSMWRYQDLYEAICKNPRFKAVIVVMPNERFVAEQQKKDTDELIRYLSARKSNFIVVNHSSSNNVIKDQKPDILFYPQPYLENFEREFDHYNFRFRLLCYYPYAFWMSKGRWSYDQPLHNYAWKLFYSTELHRKDAQVYALNRGRNVEVVGYPNADDFMRGNHHDIWKPQGKAKKRIIWAPHFTITSGYVTQSNFLWMADFMLDAVDRYSDKIQFVFKPHPRLFTELCKHEEWGEERTREYYKAWQSKENTQMESGEFIDLFMTSDAMIHDSGSFCVEYHYSGNPTMYIAKNFEEQVAEKGEFGQLAMRKHYVGKNKEDIIHFIEDVVLGGDDPMKEEREEFARQYLIPPHGKTVAENTMDILLKAFC